MLKNAQTPLLHIADVSGSALFQGDCLDIMPLIPDKSVQLILADLPYGTTACKWDSIIDLDLLWKQYKRILKDNGAILLFGSEPFSSNIRMSNMKMYKYDWIWNKKLAGNGILAKKQPLKIHEIVSIFNSKIYYPLKTKGIFRKKMKLKVSEINGGDGFCEETKNDDYYPVSIQEFGIGNLRKDRLHPTQKPVALLEYLIKTYTNENDIVLDNCMGSGSTGVACINTNRSFIGIELDETYFNIAKKRIEEVQNDLCNN